jgi:NAD(P)-dependent dehydrogenase (short-subunit alcohol dehydrogenase family)
MDTGLAGKVVLITGATRNHGRASALAFAREGAHLLLCTRRSMADRDFKAHFSWRQPVTRTRDTSNNHPV